MILWFLQALSFMLRNPMVKKSNLHQVNMQFIKKNQVKNTISEIFIQSKNVLKRIINKSGGDGVFILTARPQAVEKHVHRYLKDIGITQRIPVVGLQSNNPKDKADWIEDKIDNEGYDDVYFADDSLKNVNATKSMLRRKNIKWRVQHIKH